MFGSEVLDVAIGLIFVYLLLSLVCSSVSELIEAWLKKRATDLERGLREMLKDPNGTGLVKQLYNHPLVSNLFVGTYDPTAIKNGIYKGKASLPTYIPAKNFALALMDIVMPATNENSSGASGAIAPLDPKVPFPSLNPLEALRRQIGSIGNEEVERALLALVDAAGNDVSKARENIEHWFNSSMDRVSGWYKRRSHRIIFFLGLAVAITVNADTITIGNTLSYDQAMRESLVTAAQEYAKSSPSPTPTAGGTTSTTTTTTTPASTSTQRASAARPCERDVNSPECRIERNLAQIKKLGLPVGWDRSDPRTIPDSPGGWLLKVIGWIITAFAVSLGAPFWFDMLNKIMVIRSTVKPHEKSREEASEDRQKK
jgi:hypothetical protein